ncbi:glucosyltransferase [Neopestalotiopsis sp. 37M]|nr:glucosyltransferase [Neopestalotiopsis sp. 37M]
MSTLNENIDLLLTPTVLRTTIGATIIGLALCTDVAKGRPGYSRWQLCKQFVRNYAAPLAVPTILGLIWLNNVNLFVPKPYMDEIFHIPQAQVYCEGKHTQWDDKITTPPGLYYLSIIWARVSGHQDCSADTLRRFNVFATAVTAAVATACRSTIEGSNQKKNKSNSIYSIHTGVNIALFPVLFFFSGLYYTDVISTCVVLVAYQNHLSRTKQDSAGISFTSDLYAIFLGVLALCMRQTNVFWVVVYMGGLEAVQAVRDLPVGHETPVLDTWAKQAKFLFHRSSIGDVHDISLEHAWPEDLVLSLLSIGIAAIFNIGHVLRRVFPHLVIVALFAGFVFWNGGVVLGDKTNHVATLHLAQMLYIWPLFAFFSAPLFLPQALHLLGTLQRYASPSDASKPSKASGQPKNNSSSEINYLGIVLSVLVVAGAIIVAALIVHFNTIIHPFTLADNRHYMFYIFRYSVMRGPIVRLLLAPVYVFCAVLVWTSLYRLKPQDLSTAPITRASSAATGVPTSQVLILLLTTALSLMTAPLVEPRYFILPWIFWRLSVPQRTNQRRGGWDWSLALETAWFLAVNAVLMYIFLARPYVWKTDDGQILDGGNVQRFMW